MRDKRGQNEPYAKILREFASLQRKSKSAMPLRPSADGIKKLRAYLRPYAPEQLFAWLEMTEGFSIGDLPTWIGGSVLGVKSYKSRGLVGIRERMDEKDTWPRRDLIPIATEGSGQLYCIVASEIDEEVGITPVALVDAVANDKIEFYVASSFPCFLNALLDGCRRNKYDWYSDKKRMLKGDPMLEKVAQPRLAWATYSHHVHSKAAWYERK